jgi:putative transposase
VNDDCCRENPCRVPDTSKAILKWANDNKVEWHYIDPGKPQQNGYIASFNGSLRPSHACEHALPGNGRMPERGDLWQPGRRPSQAGHLALRLQQRQAAFSAGQQAPAEARRAIEQLDGNAPDALATPENDDYQTQGFSL